MWIRIVANLLLGIISFGLTAPAFADSESTLPACCRRNGLHHCARSMAARSESRSPALQATGQTCRFYPAVGVSAVHQAFVDLPAAVRVEAVRRLARARLSSVWPQLASSNSNFQRGPPALF